MNVRRAGLDGTGRRFAVVVSRFNEFFTRHLLDACVEELRAHGVRDADVTATWVPGAFEIPLTARRCVEAGGVDAVVTLGCIIRGETSHYDHVATECAKGIAEAGRLGSIPVVFGVVTAETVEQAIERCGSKAGNKGAEAARAALEMANLMRTFDGRPPVESP